MRKLLGLLGSALLAAFAQPAHAACEDLVGSGGDGVAILGAAQVEELPELAAYRAQGAPEIELPAFCRVKGVVSSVTGSRIGFELWLPAAGWNHRLRMFGNGGYSSSMPFGPMAAALASGYAVTATDTGHQGDDPAFAIGLPESIVDWGHRAVHETIVAAKALTRGFYGADAKYSYFEGCSTGGHQALQEAQRYPADFDGIVAGAPGHNRTHLNAAFLWQFVQNHEPTAPYRQILQPAKLRVLHLWALKVCRADNGVTAGLASDPYIADPLACRFDPAVAACTPGADESQCLTPAEVAAARRMYDGTRNPRTGGLIYPPWLPGSEGIGPEDFPLPGWSLYWADPPRPDRPARETFWRFWGFAKDWRWQDFDFDRDMTVLDDRLAGEINAMSEDLSAFHARGGKLIQYHGLADPVVSPWDSVDYFHRVRERTGEGNGEFYRLFLAPGVGHCAGGPGPSRLDTQSALEAWVERGEAPATLTAGGEAPDGGAITRPLCPFPQQARPIDGADHSSAEGFRCVAGANYANPIAEPYRR